MRGLRMSRTHVRSGTALCAVLLVAACSYKEKASDAGGLAYAEGAAAAAGDANGALLAYEHTVGVQLDRAAIAPRLQAIRSACSEARFGTCTLIEAQQSAGDWPQARAVMRMAPDAIEPMIALAAEGGDTGERSTRAEDLAVVVRDNTTEQDRLTKEMARLQAFEARGDLSVADMIALSERIAAAEAQLEAAAREGARHRQRIDTQLLTVQLRGRNGEQGRSEIGAAFREFGATLATGTAWTIRATAFLLPLALVGFFLFAALRALWRRRRRG